MLSVDKGMIILQTENPRNKKILAALEGKTGSNAGIYKVVAYQKMTQDAKAISIYRIATLLKRSRMLSSASSKKDILWWP